MSGCFQSMQWNACVHRQDLGLYSHPKEFLGNRVRPMLTPREKSPLPKKFSPEEDGTHNAASSKQPSTLSTSYSGPDSMFDL